MRSGRRAFPRQCRSCVRANNRPESSSRQNDALDRLCEMSRSCHSAMFFERSASIGPHTRARPQTCSLDTGCACAASRAAALLAAEGFLRLAHFSPLQVPDFKRDFFQAWPSGSPVWKDTPRAGRAESPATPPEPRPGQAARRWRLPLPVRMRCVAHGAGNFSYSHLPRGVAEAIEVARFSANQLRF